MTEASTEVELYNHALFPTLLDQAPEAVTARFAQRFMAAQDIDDLFEVLGGNTTAKMIGKAIEVLTVAWAPYEADAGVIPMAICTAMDLATGEAIEFATTGTVLTMFIRRAELIDALPFQAKIVGKKTRSGQTALNFERV